MKNIIKGFGLALAMVASSAQAIPTLFFDGDINYNVNGGLLTVSSVLTGTSDIAPAPTLLGSSLNFSASFIGSTTTFYTIGNFGTTLGTDLMVMDGDSNTLLTGNFNSLVMKGFNGLDSGLVSATLNADGGSLQNKFGIGNLVALQFNMTTTFSSEMFDSDFRGNIDGRIEGKTVDVPEPAVLTLLALGVLFMGFVNKTGRNRKFNV